MNKSKAKIASKNNPEGRGQQKEYLYNNKKILPIKLITNTQSFFGAEYEESGEVVVDDTGSPLTWASAKSTK